MFNKRAILRFISLVSVTFLVISLFVVASVSAKRPGGATICHKQGTPAEKTLVVDLPGALDHINNHGDTIGPCAVDKIIDADGIASAGDGVLLNTEVTVGTLLAAFPTVFGTNTGLDWFDNDGNGQWTLGDDLHSEGTGLCPTAIRDGIHQLGRDCKILDYDNSLFTGQQVDCDLEVDFVFDFSKFPAGSCNSTITNVRYHDANGDNSWNNGEDIVLDVNGNGIFD